MAHTSSPPRRVWLTLQGAEIIELKQVMMDRDVAGARACFYRVVVPRVRADNAPSEWRHPRE